MMQYNAKMCWYIIINDIAVFYTTCHLFLIFTTPISRVLFGDDYLQYLDIVRMVAFIQMGIAYANYFWRY